MKHSLIFLNKKIILCLFFVLFLLFAKVSFVFAGDVQVLNFTAPANNTVVPGMGADNNMIFNITFKVPVVPSGTTLKTPNDIDTIYFEGHTDTSPVHKVLVFNGKKTDYSGQTKSFSFYDSSKDYSFDSFVYNFKVYDYYTKTVYKEGQLTFKSNINYKGYYYIYKQQSTSVQTENIYSRSEKFADLLSCTNAWATFKNQNPKAVEYKACQEYEYLPAVPNNDAYVSVDPNKDTNTDGDVYNLLAPIGELKQAPKNVGDYFNIIFKIAIGLCGALAVIMIVIGGVQYMGDESVFGKTEAKSQITKAILGLLIALGAYALLNTIDPNLLGKKGVNIAQVTAEISEGNQYRLEETQNTPEAKTFKRTSYYAQIKNTTTTIPHCLIQVAIQRESGGNPSVGHDEDVPSSNIPSRRDFVSSGKKFDGSTFDTTGKTDPKITQGAFKNSDHPNSYLKAPNPNANDLGLDWRFSHSIGMFGVTFGPNHINPSGAKAIYSDQNTDISKASSMMKDFYNNCNHSIEGTWRAYGTGSCTGNNNFTNKETAIRVSLYNQCVSQDK